MEETRDGHQVERITTVICGITVEWLTDCVNEVVELNRVLRYHVRDYKEVVGLPRHKVEFCQIEKRITAPKDSELVWKGPYIVLTSDGNEVKWVRSESTGLDYIYLTKEVTIVHDRKSFQTRCYLLSKKKRGKWIRPRIWDSIVLILHTVMSIHGRYSIHSAAVAIDGKAHLFIGESGNGKSTLCNDLTAMGSGYMGDDLSFLYFEKGKLMLGSLLMEAKLFPDSHAKDKDWVDIIANNGCAAPLALPLGAIYYISRREGECVLEYKDPMECMMTLIQHSNHVRMQFDKELWKETFIKASEQLPFRLFYFGKRESLSLDLFRDV